MSDAPSIVDQVGHAADLLADIEDAAATLVARALRRWLDGESLESGLNLPTDWRWRERIAKRNRALLGLIALNPGAKTAAIARRIVTELPGCALQQIRPDAASGHIWDLASVGGDLGERQMRRVIDELRGHSDRAMSRNLVTGSAPRRTNAKTDQD